MFPASWPVVEAVRASLQLASVNRGSAARVSPVGHPCAQWLRGFAQSGLPDYVVCHPLARLELFAHTSCEFGFLDVLKHFNTSELWIAWIFHHIMQIYAMMFTLGFLVCVCVCVQRLYRAALIMDKGGGETSWNLLPASAVSNLASSNGQLANGRAIPQGQQLLCRVVHFHLADSNLSVHHWKHNHRWRLQCNIPVLLSSEESLWTAADQEQAARSNQSFFFDFSLLLIILKGDHPLSEPFPLFLQGQKEWPVALYGRDFYDVVRAVWRPPVPLSLVIGATVSPWKAWDLWEMVLTVSKKFLKGFWKFGSSLNVWEAFSSPFAANLKKCLCK